MATIKDVAKLAGVSICTVSRALANKENITGNTICNSFKASIQEYIRNAGIIKPTKMLYMP